MTTYQINRPGHFYPAFTADSVGTARLTVEEILEPDIEPGFGFRWIHVMPKVWRYQAIHLSSAEVAFSADLVVSESV